MSSGSPRERRRLAWCQRRTEAPARRKGAPTRRPRALASRIPTVGSYSLYEFISMPYHCNKGFLGVTPLKLQCGTCRSFSCDAGPLLKAGDRLRQNVRKKHTTVAPLNTYTFLKKYRQAPADATRTLQQQAPATQTYSRAVACPHTHTHTRNRADPFATNTASARRGSCSVQ